MKLLFDDKLSPITKEIGFLEIDIHTSVNTFTNWMNPIENSRNNTLKKRLVSGCLEEVLKTLLPLTSVEPRRYLFIPTDNNGIAFFDNGHQGTDVTSKVMVLVRMIKCQGYRILAVPNTIQRNKSARGRYGGIMFEVFAPDPNLTLNYKRAINVANDGGRWIFDQSGEPFSFEDIESYKKRRIKDRFTFEMLKEYCAHLGLRPFDEDFYLPSYNNKAVLIEKEGPCAPGLKEYTLEEARRRY